ncbi:MAG: class I SAM-dependent methyltransferase [Planctomycetia bacterium]|nr:class I SAM-dependent methyltransferase [Planctomycetia bacterium]
MEKTPFAYGTSVPFLDTATIELLRNLYPARVVDIGAGAGKYGRICRELFGDAIHLTAVDGCPITCEHLKTEGRYNVVENLLIDQWIQKTLTEKQETLGKKRGKLKNQRPCKKYDLIICGDVLEHLTRKQCFRTINNFLRLAETVLVVVPLRNVIQEEQDENPLELHKAYLLDSDFEKRYIIGEKHSVMSPNWHIFSAWILARKRNKWTDKIKTFLLKCGGHRAYTFLSKIHVNTQVETDYFMYKASEMKSHGK